MFYQLHKHCYLVKGAARGAIYDLQSGKVYSINRSAVYLLESCQARSVEETLGELSETGEEINKECKDFLNNLTDKQLGAFTAEPAAEETNHLSSPPPAKLDFAWLELTEKCNNRCLHCYAASGPASKSDQSKQVPHDRWLSLITEVREAGADALQFIGGEPLLYPRWRELVEQACKESFSVIEIFTNATLIDDEAVNFFRKHHLSIATTIYADNETVHDQITVNPGSFVKTMAAIRKILDAGIPLRIASIIMKPNEKEADGIMALCQQLGVEAAPPDVIRPTGRGADTELAPENYRKPPIKPPFYTTEETFFRAPFCHNCLSGKLAVTANGDVYPCIFARGNPCGNILTAPLSEVLQGVALQTCWQTTKDKIEKCRDCEYRYACPDCRPLAQSQDTARRWLAPVNECLYNPYTGKWEEEINAKR